MKSNTDSCKACEHSGLPILFLYHGVVAKDADFSPVAEPVNKLFAPSEPHLTSVTGRISLTPKPVFYAHEGSNAALKLPALSYARYALRSLRPGVFLYVYHEKPSPALKAAAETANKTKKPNDPSRWDPQWEVFRMLQGGALVPPDDPRFTMPTEFACKRGDGTHGLTTLTYRLRDAHEETKLRVGVSANLWDASLRAKNLPHLQEIDVASVLASTALPPDAVRPDSGSWFNAHVLDFALDRLHHGGFDGSSALAPRKDCGASMLKRMHDLSAGHPKTKGKGFVMCLRDAIGTAQALADLSVARRRQAEAYALSQRHPLCAANAIDALNQQILEEQVATAKQDPLCLDDLRYDDGSSKIAPAAAKDLPPQEEWKDWVSAGVMTRGAYDRGRFRPMNSGITAGSRFLALSRQQATSGRQAMVRGLVIAPAAEMGEVRAYQSSGKMRRVHKPEEVTRFKDRYELNLKSFGRLIDQHNSDRQAVLMTEEVCAAFNNHFDPKDPNTPGKLHIPGLVYLREACSILIADGHVSPSMEAFAIRSLRAAPESPHGWAIRVLVANQYEMFKPLKTVLQHQGGWLLDEGNATDEDHKLDKTYDTVKGLLTDDALQPKVGWLGKAGIGLSFGLAGFWTGAAVQLAAKVLEATPAGAAAANYMADPAAATEAALKKLDTVEGRLARNLERWGMLMEDQLNGVINKVSPDRTRIFKVRVTGRQFLDLMSGVNDGLESPGPKRSVTNTANRDLSKLPKDSPILDEMMDVYFRSTDNTIKEAANLAGINKAASRVWAYPPDGARIRPVEIDAASLAKMFRNAHRFDAAKALLLKLVGESLPSVASAAIRGAGATAQATVSSAGGVATVANNIKGSAGGRTAGDLGAQMGLAGAFLQWRLLQDNEVKLEKLHKRLREAKLTGEQREIVEGKIAEARFGVVDNWAGIAGGLFEVAAVATKEAGGVWMASRFTIGAGVAGAVGNAMNAMVNFQRAAGKFKEGQKGFLSAYGLVGALYFGGAVAFGAAAKEVFQVYAKRRVLLTASIRGAAAQQLTAGAGRAIARRVLFLSFTGWGLVLTLAAFAIEGIVVYMDRTPLEAWLENSYFGDKPKFRGLDGKQNLPGNWDAELKALEEAIKKAMDEMQAETDISPLEPAAHLAAAL
jgi:hypothetical protein